MMRLFVAGGCGEHGRNSFLLEDGMICVLVDCGIISEPQLRKAENYDAAFGVYKKTCPKDTISCSHELQ